MRQYLRSLSSPYFPESRVLSLCSAALTALFVLFCSLSASAQLTVSASSASVCAGTSTTLTVAGCPASGTVRWSTNQTSRSIVVAPTQTTPYAVTCAVTGVGAATATTTTTASTSVQVNPAIVVTPTPTPISCSSGGRGSVFITATGGTGALLYQFNNQPFQEGKEYSGLEVGTYPVVVKDAIGCTAQATVEIKQAPPLSLSITVVPTKCTGGADGGIVAVASGGAGDYRYYLNNGTPQQTGTFVDLKANTTYSIAVTDKQGCLAAQSVPIGGPTPFDIKLTTTPSRCLGAADGTISVSATGGTGPYQYQLGTNGFQTGALFTGLSAATYDITIRDAIGCQGKQSVAVGQPNALTLTATSRPVNCSGVNSGSISVTAAGGTGAVLYQLAGINTFQPGNVFTGVAVGAYTVVGIDANGCTSPTSVTVGQSEPLKIQTLATSPATCCVCPTGVVSLTSTGGTGTRRQYQVVGQAVQPGSQLTGLRPNVYQVQVSDEVGCTDLTSVTITNGSALSLSTASLKNVACAGGNDGEATMQVAGGTRPFTYYWITDRRDTLRTRTATQTGLSEGTYTVSVVDSNRCTTSTAFVSIKSLNPVPFKPTVSQSGSTLVVDQSAGIQWYVRTGIEPGVAVPNATQPTITPFQSGQYYVIITANGCSSPPSDAVNFVLTALPDPDVNLSIRVVPNPVVDRLRVEIEQPDRSAVQLQLLDASGRAVRQYQLPAFVGKKQAEWPLTGVSAGTYLLKASAGNRRSALRVVVE